MRVAHAQAQVGVRPPGLLGRGDGLAVAAGQLAVQADERLERLVGHRAAGPDGGQAERRVDRAALRPVELDLQRGARRRRRGSSRSASVTPRAVGEGVQQGQPRLAPAVLHEGQLAARDADLRAELVEGQAVAPCGSGGCAGPSVREISHHLTDSERYGDFTSGFSKIAGNASQQLESQADLRIARTENP